MTPYLMNDTPQFIAANDRLCKYDETKHGLKKIKKNKIGREKEHKNTMAGGSLLTTN